MFRKSFFSKPFAQLVARRGDRVARNAVAAQARQFEELVATGERTVFGREHHLERGMTVEEFQTAVPVRDYEGLRPWMERVVAGEGDVVWPGSPLYFCKTSGTTSGAKFIPITAESMGNHTRAARNALLTYIAKTGKADFVDGKMIFLQGSPELDETPGGTPLGRLSGIVAHHVPSYLQRNRLPSYETNCIGDWETKVDAIVRETAGQDLRLISGIPSWVQMYFERLLEFTGKANVLEVFPNFSLFVYGGVAFAPYEARFRQLIGGDVPSVELYPASEGFIAYQDVPGERGMRLNVDDGLFFEFIPADEILDEHPTRLTLEEVECDVAYALVITSNAGLWAYDIGDTVKFTSVSPPRLVVAGRTKHYTSAFGEHVISDEVEGALAEAVRREGGTVTEFHVAPQVQPPEGLPYHEWFVEFDAMPGNAAAWSKAVDAAMQRLNPYYGDLIKGSVLQPAIVRILGKGAFMDAMRRKEKLGGQNKVPRLANHRHFAAILATENE